MNLIVEELASICSLSW